MNGTIFPGDFKDFQEVTQITRARDLFPALADPDENIGQGGKGDRFFSTGPVGRVYDPISRVGRLVNDVTRAVPPFETAIFVALMVLVTF